MRTTIEIPDEIMISVKTVAVAKGVSLRQFVLDAIMLKLAPEKQKIRKAPPAIGEADAPRLKALTREQIDEAMFG